MVYWIYSAFLKCAERGLILILFFAPNQDLIAGLAHVYVLYAFLFNSLIGLVRLWSL